MESFEHKLRKYLANNRVAEALFEDVAKQSMVSAETLTALLSEASDPVLEKKVRTGFARMRSGILSRKSRRVLADNLRKTGERLKTTFENPIVALFPEAATIKATRSPDDQHIREGRKRAHARMRHQAGYLRSLLGFLLGSSSEFFDRRMQSVQQLQQLLPAPTGPRR